MHIAVDLDGTLAEYDHWKGESHIGPPIPAMVRRVKKALELGHEITIFTARVSVTTEYALGPIQDWCQQHFGRIFPVTATKHYHFDEIWDDRAVGVQKNTGRFNSDEVAQSMVWDEVQDTIDAEPMDVESLIK